MAYNIYNGVRKLVVSFNGQSEDTIENIQSAQFDNAAAGVGSLLRNNPYYSYSLVASGYTNWSSSDAVLYAQLEALQPGTLSIKTLCSMINAGEYIKIYRQGNPNTYLYFTKPSGVNFDGCSVYLYYNGASVGKDFGTYLGVNYGVQQISRIYSIGFLYDSGIDKFALYTVNVANPLNSGSHGNTIMEKVGTAVSANSGQIANIQAALEVLLRDNITPEPPYDDDDYTTSTGGNGNHDDTSDTITDAALPLFSTVSSGMCTAWVPTIGEMKSVAKALINPNIAQIIWNTVVKLSDVIIGLSLFPCTIPATDTDNVEVNFLGALINTGVECHTADNQFVEISCGELTVNEYWGNCLDYNPYTRISIYLPFCGTYELDTDEVMGKTLNVSYRVDILSGSCLATIKIGGSIFYQYTGQCSAQIPLSSVSFDGFLSSMIDVGIATATGVGAIGAAGAAAKEAETAFHASAGSGTGGSALMEAREHLSSVKTKSADSIADATAGAVMGNKGYFSHAGALSGSPGFLAVKKPFLIIKRPEQVVPSTYGMFHGYPCNTTATLGDLTGYTEVSDIRLNIPDATVEEILECEQLLKGGVVI